MVIFLHLVLKMYRLLKIAHYSIFTTMYKHNITLIYILVVFYWIHYACYVCDTEYSITYMKSNNYFCKFIYVKYCFVYVEILQTTKLY